MIPDQVLLANLARQNQRQGLEYALRLSVSSGVWISDNMPRLNVASSSSAVDLLRPFYRDLQTKARVQDGLCRHVCNEANDEVGPPTRRLLVNPVGHCPFVTLDAAMSTAA